MGSHFTREDCKCVWISGHLEGVKWLLWRHEYRPSPGALAVADWTHSPHHWLNYVESSDGLLPDDDVLKTTDSRYWSIHDPQRYFLLDLHCEQVLFTQQYPSLRLPSRLGRTLWRENAATKLPPYVSYRKELALSLEVSMKKMEKHREQVNRLIISDQLLKVHHLDYFKRRTFFRILEDIFSCQKDLQLVSLENLECDRLEGVRLVEKLALFNAHSLKYLFLWRFVLPNENPILINYRYLTGPGLYIPRPDTRKCFLRSLGVMMNLRVLALEYAHLADSTGVALISLLPILKRPHFRLQFICRTGHVPGYTDASLGAGGYDIPDTAWRRINIACPDLYVLMVFYRIRDYDNVRRFLTPSIPLRETHLQYGIDLTMRQRQDSDISCFVGHIAYQYGSTITTFSIHQWRFVLFPLRRVIELMPFLARFYYVGLVDEIDLRRMLQIIVCGVCHKMKHLYIQIQDEEPKREYWRNVVDSLTQEHKEVLELFGINFCISIYKQ